MMRFDLEELQRFYETARRIPPKQLLHRVRLRAQKPVFARYGDRLLRVDPADAAGPGWPQAFRPLDADGPWSRLDASAITQGEFTLLNKTVSLAQADTQGSGPKSNKPQHSQAEGPDPTTNQTTPQPPDPTTNQATAFDWRTSSDDQLWRYTLHYFEWAWSLARTGDQAGFERLFRSWSAGTTVGAWDEWSPYVVALRSWALCGLHGPLAASTPIDSDLRVLLKRQQLFLRRNTERDVRGNHLIKNLKALIGLGVFFDDDVDTVVQDFVDELAHQVLSDGGHYERSPAYHCQVLGDVIDVAGLLRVVGRDTGALDDVIERMQRWLGAMLHPDGQTATFNDCWPIDAADIARLGPIEPEHGLTALPESGYLTFRDDRRYVVTDVGIPCPPELPAHAHADTLSIEVSVDGERVIVNGGVSTYAGERRAYERSTAAHSTVEVAGENSTDVYGSFRAGRRANPAQVRFSDDGDTVTMAASHDGYRHLLGAPVVRREITIDAEAIEITDSVEGGSHKAVSRFHLSPGVAATIDGEMVDLGAASMLMPGGGDLTSAVLATDFGSTSDNLVVSQRLTTGGRVVISLD